jgi:hypothetical protein
MRGLALTSMVSWYGSPGKTVASVFSCLAALLASSGAIAQEYCVSCSGPNGLYRCVIDGARPGVTSSLQLLCVERLAKEGGHASCSVKRGVTVFECDAPVKRVAVTDMDAPPVNAVVPVPQPAVQAASASSGEPATVLEAAKRAKEATDRELKKAGEQMKVSVEKTNAGLKNAWRCVTSLFTRCGGE